MMDSDAEERWVDGPDEKRRWLRVCAELGLFVLLLAMVAMLGVLLVATGSTKAEGEDEPEEMVLPSGLGGI